MAFLMLSSQKSLLTMRKNQLQFEYSCKLNKIQNLKKQETEYAKIQNKLYEAGVDTDGDGTPDDTSWDMENDAYYNALLKEEESITVDSESLQSQITIIDGELSALKTMVTNDVKQATSLNLLGGG